MRARDVNGGVARAVVDDQQLDRVDARDSRGRSARVAGSCSASLKQGIWMISFIGESQRVPGPPAANEWAHLAVHKACTRDSHRDRPPNVKTLALYM